MRNPTNPEKLLELLKSEPGKIFSLAEVWRKVWEYQYDGALSDRVTIYVAIHAVRQMLGPGEKILMFRGKGYQYVTT